MEHVRQLRGGLSAADFVRVATVQTLTRAGLQAIGPHAIALATAEGLTAPIRQRFPELAADFSHMTTRTLVVHGDQDGDPRETTRGASWHAEPYHLSPGADALVTLPGAKHFLGGVMGYDLAESDE